MNLETLLRRLPVSYMLMGSVVAVSLLAFASERIRDALLLQPVRVRRGEVHRLLTAGWIHGDAGHLLTNMFVLFLFADRALKLFGPLAFVIFYTSAVIVAYIPTSIRYRKNPRYSSLGASGAVAAVMLSAILVDPTIRLRFLFFPVPIPGVIFGALYLLYSIWHSHGSDDNINHDAHFSGAAYGILVTYLWAPQKVEHTLRVLRRMIGV
jgi:membrane associated rhomboid family serine protease